MNILLQHGSCDGQVANVNEYARSHWRHPQGRRERYRHLGATDPATGYAVFAYAPLRRRGRA